MFEINNVALLVAVILLMAAVLFAQHQYIKIRRINKELTETQKALRELNADLETRVQQRTSELMVEVAKHQETEEALKQSNLRLNQAIGDAINAMSQACEMRDPYTAGHQRRVAQLAMGIAEEINLPEEQKEGLRIAAVIHDIGKICVPAELLSKAGKLSALEFDLIKSHTNASYSILQAIKFSTPVAQIAYQHHERIDGSGYPLGLKDGQICIEAKILAVADVVEAMSSHRPYRMSLGIDNALQEISTASGTLFDTNVVDACLRLFNEKKFQFEDSATMTKIY